MTMGTTTDMMVGMGTMTAAKGIMTEGTGNPSVITSGTRKQARCRASTLPTDIVAGLSLIEDVRGGQARPRRAGHSRYTIRAARHLVGSLPERRQPAEI